MTEPSKGYDELYKIILVGDSSVGKTSFLIRLTKNVIKKQTQPTIGVEYAAQSILLSDVDKIVKAVIWDTAGAEKYKAITTAHYRKSEGALLFYDLADKNSFDNIQSWRQEVFIIPELEIIQHTDDKIVIMVIGNKLDLVLENPQARCVSEEEVQQFCTEFNMLYHETSAKEGTNVKECFEQLIRSIDHNILEIYEQKQLNIEEEIIPPGNYVIENFESEKKTDGDKLNLNNATDSNKAKKPQDNCCGTN